MNGKERYSIKDMINLIDLVKHVELGCENTFGSYVASNDVDIFIKRYDGQFLMTVDDESLYRYFYDHVEMNTDLSKMVCTFDFYYLLWEEGTKMYKRIQTATIEFNIADVDREGYCGWKTEE